MRFHKLTSEQRLERPLPEVFEFFSRAGNLERITPPWLRFSILGDEPDPVVEGCEIRYKLRVHGFPTRWISRIDAFEQNRMFIDRQLVGPYKMWIHQHEFEADGDATIIRDTVRYQLPFGILGALAHLLFVRRDLQRIFDYRHAAVETILS